MLIYLQLSYVFVILLKNIEAWEQKWHQPFEAVRAVWDASSPAPNVVPQVRDRWLMLKLQDGSWEIPGGTLEPGETYLKAARRELLEEAGARLITFQLFVAWHCYSQAAKPYRPHLPFPEFYRVVGIGAVEVVQSPKNPADGEQIIRVEAVSLETAVERFTGIGRHDLADLYHLADDIATTY